MSAALAWAVRTAPGDVEKKGRRVAQRRGRRSPVGDVVGEVVALGVGVDVDR
jgi:hypothetical protein